MKKKRSKWKFVWQLVYIFGTMLIIYFLGFADPEFKKLSENLTQFDPFWLWMCLAALLGFWVIQGCVLAYCTRLVGDRISYWKNLKVTLIGEYYSAITPFSTGGQPMQMGYYKRYGVNFAKSTCILGVRFIGYIFSMCICYVLVMIFRGTVIYQQYNGLFWLTTFGFVINFVMVLFILMVLINKKLITKIGMFVINVMTKFKLFRNKREHLVEKFLKGVDDFSSAGAYLKTAPLKAVGVILISFASVVCLYSICYFIYRAMGLNAAGYIDLFTMQVFLYLAVSFFPTPGAIGASEGGFYMFFGSFFSPNFIYLAMMLWRLFTYYSNLIIGAILIIWDEVYTMIRGKKERPNQPPSDVTPSE